MKPPANDRRYDLDWLRIFGILVVFIYHSSRFFNLGDWHIKNPNTYLWVEFWNVFATRWMMPLFFIISGASLFYAIDKASGLRRFMVDKFLRLMIPVLVASVTHGALQVYLDRLTHGQFSGSFFAFLPAYFSGIYMDIGMTGNFAFHGMHLWYLLFLFFYSLICYPLFIWLNGRGQAVLSRITRLFSIPGLMHVCFLLPLLAMKTLIPHAVLSVGAGGWGFLYYIWFLISGFMVVSSDRLQHRIQHQRWISAALAVMLTWLFLHQLFSPSRAVFPDWIGGWINTLLSFSSAWCWLLAILGFGMRHLRSGRPWLRYANEGVLPFYILHQTILLAVGYFVLSWGLADVWKWVAVTLISFTLIIALDTLLVRNIDALRFLFGMKTTRSFFQIFRNGWVLVLLTTLYIGLFGFAIANPSAGTNANLSSAPLVFDPEKDVLLTCDFITDKSSSGILVVDDTDASKGKAIEFVSGASDRPLAQPEVYVEMRFSAPAGRYHIWLRGKSDLDNAYTDSVWLQVDDQIGTPSGGLRLGNWLDVHPPGTYGWAGDTDDPVVIELASSGEHRIRIQPRQTPHRIDQIWLSRAQLRIPGTLDPVE